MKANACFSHDSWSSERGMRPETPAKKQKLYPFDRCVSLRMRKTKANLLYTKCISVRLPQHRDVEEFPQKRPDSRVLHHIFCAPN